MATFASHPFDHQSVAEQYWSKVLCEKSLILTVASRAIVVVFYVILRTSSCVEPTECERPHVHGQQRTALSPGNCYSAWGGISAEPGKTGDV